MCVVFFVPVLLVLFCFIRPLCHKADRFPPHTYERIKISQNFCTCLLSFAKYHDVNKCRRLDKCEEKGGKKKKGRRKGGSEKMDLWKTRKKERREGGKGKWGVSQKLRIAQWREWEKKGHIKGCKRKRGEREKRLLGFPGEMMWSETREAVRVVGWEGGGAGRRCGLISDFFSPGGNLEAPPAPQPLHPKKKKRKSRGRFFSSG